MRHTISAALMLAWTVSAADGPSFQGHRSRELRRPAAGSNFLERLSPTTTGLVFTHFVSESVAFENSLRTEGAGVAAGDVDGDGWCDLFFCGNERPSVLYRNLGNWRFEVITARAGVACPGQPSTGATFADTDGDHDLDLLVNSLGGRTRLFLNDGTGKFTEALDSGLVRKFGGTSLALADIDGNGTLDLYVANYATTKIEDRPNTRFDSRIVNGEIVLAAIDGQPITSPDLANRYFVDRQRVVRERGEPDILYLNDGRGRFTPVSWTNGVFADEAGAPLLLPPYDFGLSVMFRDLNGDRTPDIYVCNDLFPPDRIWINDGRGRFRAMSNLAVRNTSRFSMGVDFGDINRDGHDDFFVVDMLSRDHRARKVQTSGVDPIFLPVGRIDNRPQYKRNTLFLSRGDGTYAEIAQFSGLEATEWSWMPAFLDVDLDGFEDVLVTTGHFRDSLHADAVEQILKARAGRRLSDAEHRALKKKFYPVLHTANQAFRNRGDLTFEDKASEWGFDYVGISQAMALADLDNDGDQDVVVVHLNDVVGLYRNQSAAPRVAVRLRGRPPNTHGIGARIRLLGGAVPEQSQEIVCGGRYLSGDDTLRVFAASAANRAMKIHVLWRSGAETMIEGVQPNRLYEISEPEIRPETQAAQRELTKQNEKPLFEDVSALLRHTHVDEGFDDFERQPSLPKRLSQSGPGASWYDLDADGWDDLIITSGGGGQLAVFRNDRRGGFEPWSPPVLGERAVRDQTTVLGWSFTNGHRTLLVGSSNYEDAVPRGGCVREFDLSNSAVRDALPAWECSTGPLAMADWDRDGILDLFVGGRALPGRYPEAPFSLLCRGTGQGFELDRASTKQIAHAGLVSGATFSDLDGDGWPELVLACEWGSVRVFDYQQRQWRERTRELQLERYSGWWNGVATGDFDGDGRLDIVASNWGRNTKYQSHRHGPLRIWFGDWKGNGMLDAFEAYREATTGRWVPWCSFSVTRAVPWIAARFPTHDSFARASMEEILGERQKTASVLEADWLETTLFYNRGDHFEARLLPTEAQLAPAFGICIGDADGDGDEDIFLSQNFFAVDGDTSRYDAGRGLWLFGDGHGEFRAVPGQESGIMVYGEQRGCALADYDRDGRTDLVVTQNGAETRLFRNVTSKPGVRVRLSGPAGNPSGIGAVIRLVSGGKAGPARELRAGSGYWSQDSAVQILARPLEPAEIQVRWPGGTTTKTKFDSAAREITVDWTGKLKLTH